MAVFEESIRIPKFYSARPATSGLYQPAQSHCFYCRLWDAYQYKVSWEQNGCELERNLRNYIGEERVTNSEDVMEVTGCVFSSG